RNGVLKLIALQGDASRDGRTLNFLTRPSISDSGDVAFLELLPQDAGFRTRLVPNGIFATAAGSVSAVAGKQGEGTFAGNFQTPAIVQNGDGSNALLFVAWKDVPGKNAIWVHSHGALRGLVQEGDPAAEGGTYSF